MMKTYLFFIMIFMSGTVMAQDNNYWQRQYGSISSVLGGAVVGSHNDNGSIYYNPATLSFTDSIKFSVSAALYETSNWKIKNAIANDTTLTSLGFKRFPISFFPALNLKKGFKVGLIYMPRLSCDFYFHDSQTSKADVLHNGNPVQLFTSFDYRNFVNEMWYGLSFSKKIGKRSSVGICPFVSYRFQEYTYQYAADALLDSANYQYLNTYVQKYVKYYNYKLILKGGYYYVAKDFSLGVAATVPVFTALSSGISSARVFLNGYSTVDSSYSDQYLAVNEQNDLKANHKYPFTLSFGCKIILQRCMLYISSETFFKISKYNVLDVDDSQNLFPDYANSGVTNNDLINVESASRFLTNGAIGIQFKYKKNKTVSTGFSTDFNSLPKDFSNTGTNINSSNWDIYHLSAGMDVNIKKIKISLGLRGSYGYKSNNLQFADITTAAADNALYGYRQENSNYSYWDISVLLGLNF